MRSRPRTMLASASLAALMAASGAAGADSVYQQRCVMCHGADGGGVPGIYPRLKDRVAAIAATQGGMDYLVQVVLFGLAGSIEVDAVPIEGIMPGFADLSDQDIAGVLNYIAADLREPESAAIAVAEKDVKRLRASALTPSDVHRRRAVAMQLAGKSD
jgi:mono/diheme cytochrome c family protein